MLAFVPLFVALNSLGVLPIFISLTESLEKPEKNKLIWEASLTALVLSYIFLLSGKWLFEFLGIHANDFRIGGGLILLIISISDLMFSQQESRRDPHTTGLGIVPIGTPLIMGPAAMTTILMLQDRLGYLMTMIGLTVNIIIVFLVFMKSEWIVRLIRKSGARAIGKVFSLFLAAIAVMMIRVGIEYFIKGAS